MHIKRNAGLLGLLALVTLALLLLPFGSSMAASTLATRNLAPSAYVTQSGASDGQPVANLAVLDQSGTQDTPSNYVTFTTPGVVYIGYSRFFLPGAIQRGTVTSMTVRINYKGAAKSIQAWNWYLYNWAASTWVSIGDNAGATTGVWRLFNFNPASPLRFINPSTREIRLQMRSRDTGGDAKLDFESIRFGYNFTPTITETPTITQTPTITETPTITATPTITGTPTPTVTPGGPVSPMLGGCPMYPPDNVWNTRIDTLPVNAHSSAWINSIGRNTGLHMDFGSGNWDGGPIGIPFNIVPTTQATVHMGASQFDYADESDKGYYPIPAAPRIEYGSDHHMLIIRQGECKLYELYDVRKVSGIWYAGSGAIWNLNSNALRPNTWTSADAAGLPILPGLVLYSEIASGKIHHAIRFTTNNTAGYIWPARHLTSPADPNNVPPMGARFRLKASFNISTYPTDMQVLLRAMKQYGIIIADNGSDWYISGAPDSRWNNDTLHLLDNITGNDFEAVDESSLMIGSNSGQANQP